MIQILQSGNPKADEIVLSNMTAVLDRVFLDIEIIFGFLCVIAQLP